MDLHHSLENAGFHRNGSTAGAFHKVVVQIEGLPGWRGLVETWPASLAAIAIERELRNHQQAAAGFPDTAIHLARLIRKDAQAEGLVQQIVRIGAGIVSRNTKKN